MNRWFRHFTSKDQVLEDIRKSGFWPTTYISNASPELPLHWHDGDIVGYLQLDPVLLAKLLAPTS